MFLSEEKKEYDPTGGAAYRKCCDMLGIVPVSHFLHNLQEKDTAVSLQHHGLGPKGAKAIAVALTVRSELRYRTIIVNIHVNDFDAVQHECDTT